MSIRADTLFISDERGRIVRANEVDGEPGPRLFIGRTRNGYEMRAGISLLDDTARRLNQLLERQPEDADLTIPAALRSTVREELAGHEPIAVEGGGPAYCFPGSVTTPTNVVEITPANRDVLRESFPGVHRYLESSMPCLAVINAGAAVSVCFSARNGPRAAEAGVETMSEFCGRGYATAVTAAWGARILAEGRIPLYSTWWENTASQAVARCLGLRMFGTDATWD